MPVCPKPILTKIGLHLMWSKEDRNHLPLKSFTIPILKLTAYVVESTSAPWSGCSLIFDVYHLANALFIASFKGLLTNIYWLQVTCAIFISVHCCCWFSFYKCNMSEQRSCSRLLRLKHSSILSQQWSGNNDGCIRNTFSSSGSFSLTVAVNKKFMFHICTTIVVQ